MRPADLRLLRYARAARGYLAVAVGLGLAGAALILAQAGLLAHALATAGLGAAAAIALSGTLLALLAVVAARAAVTCGAEVAALRASATVKSQLRGALAARALDLGPAWLGGRRPGEITALATRGLDGLDSYFARYVPQLVLAVVVPAAVLARVAAADWVSALIIAATLPLIPVFAAGVGWHTRARTRRQWLLLATLAGHFLDVVEGLPTLKAAGPAGARHRVAAAAVDLRSDEISLSAVTVAYPGRPRPALDGVALTIRPGERIVITGPSGAGKSSLLALLLRFIEPDAGTIQAGGSDLSAIAADRWRAQIAWVPQHPHLFAGSAADNIALGQPGAGLDAIRRAARLAGAAEFIEALPGGYHAALGERALRLSAGQRQKIALARAFLRDAPLVLLDEPAAHLDPVGARQLARAIETALAGRTVLVVSHGRGWAGGADRVIRLDQGRLPRRPARPASVSPAVLQ
jgi:ABC-type transport system involved in cytochrome bd biosynthesis fused ATPase/permease subunit